MCFFFTFIFVFLRLIKRDHAAGKMFRFLTSDPLLFLFRLGSFTLWLSEPFSRRAQADKSRSRSTARCQD